MPDESVPASPQPPPLPTTNGNGGPAPVAQAQSLARDDDQKLQGVSRSLLIAVGGTGHKILMDVRQRLIQKYGGLEKIPIVSFLLVDTDQAIFGKNPNYSDAANLDNADKIHTSVHGVEALRKNLREYPHLRDWLDPRTLSGDIHQGAGAVRARGRLAYFWNYDTISKRIEEEYSEITKDSAKAAAIKNGLQVSEGVTVYIVGSLLGGTGSGMFLDLAYTVKDLLKTQRMLEVVGIFSIPPNTSAVSVDNRPNAYASLLELNHYTDSSTTFTAQYKPDQPGIENADPPFRYTYLVDTSSPKANLGSVDKMVEMIGHSVFLDLTSEFQRQKKSNRDNFDQFLTQPDELGCPQNYLAMGLAAIHFPKDKVMHACASRLARQILTRWTEPLAKVSNVGAFTEQELGRLALDPDAVQRQTSVMNLETGELVRDTAMGFWNGVNTQYNTSYPGHNRVAEFLAARQAEHQVRFTDTDPNPDPLAKQRPNLGEYLFQLQQNLKGLIPAKEAALRSFLSECVNDPNRRHGVARAFLDHADERFRAWASELRKVGEQGKESLAPTAEARDTELGKINRYAGDFALKMIPNATRKEIDEAKDAYVSRARQWEGALLDIRVAEHSVYFYDRMIEILAVLKTEMDAYIERMKGLEAFYRKEEQLAIENPVDVNGLVIFDRGRRVEGEGGTAGYEGGDIEARYAAYVGNGADPGNATVNTTAADILAELGTGGSVYGLREIENARLRTSILSRCRVVFKNVEQESVLEKFFEKFGVGTDRAVEELRRIHGLSQPFVHLQENAPNYKHHQNKEQTIVGVLHGSEPRSEAGQVFHRMLKDTVQGIRDGQITNSNEPHQALFLRERAAFPLRLLEGMDSYRFAYDQSKAAGASANPIHTRKDVREWVRIGPPSFEDQKEAWQTFCVGWATGVIAEDKEVKYTALGAKETVRFVAHYRDRFGMAKSDPLGAFIGITGDLAKLVRAAETDEETASKPPKEGRDLVLLLCDQPQLKEQIDRMIEAQLVEKGVKQIGRELLSHVEAQNGRFERPIVRPYQQAITDYLEKINFNPDAAPVVATPAPITATVTVEPTPTAAIPATPPAPVGTLEERLTKLKSLMDAGLITKDQYDARAASILSEV